jgi:hypothetical protein
MKTNMEKRACQRHRFAADIAFSYFNKEYSYNARTLNLCSDGMCFKSNVYLQPGATIFVRLINTYPNDSCCGYCEGLHIVTMAEVKWCHVANGTDAFPYAVGVKYFGAAY